MLELSNLCHCVQHPENLLVDISGALGTKESHFLSKNVFWEMLWGISEMVNARAFKPLPLCSAKVGSSAKFCVVVCKSSLLWYCGGSIGQSRLICQVLCSGMQVISALVLGGSIGQIGFICQVLCSGMQVISVLVLGGSLAKEGLSAKFGLAVFKVSLLDCPPLCSGPLKTY